MEYDPSRLENVNFFSEDQIELLEGLDDEFSLDKFRSYPFFLGKYGIDWFAEAYRGMYERLLEESSQFRRDFRSDEFQKE